MPPAEYAAEHGGEQGVVGIAGQKIVEEVDEEGEQHRGDQRHRERVRALKAPRGQQQRDVQQQRPHTDADGRDVGQRGRKTRHAAGDQSARVIDILRSCGDQRRAQKHQDKVPQVPSPAWFPVSGGFCDSCGFRVLSGFFHTLTLTNGFPGGRAALYLPRLRLSISILYPDAFSQ